MAIYQIALFGIEYLLLGRDGIGVKVESEFESVFSGWSLSLSRNHSKFVDSAALAITASIAYRTLKHSQSLILVGAERFHFLCGLKSLQTYSPPPPM